MPIFTFKAAELNADTVMMPFWAAALLFYLRARRGLGVWIPLLAGAFASFAMLGKYWTVYLFAGMAAAAMTGTDTRRFWRSPAPYLMAAGAAVAIAPHLYWYISHAGGTNYAFVRDSVMTDDSFAAALGKSVYYALGVIAYAAGPLLLLAALRPGRAALADIAWPADDERRQALILFAVPMVLPALVNLVVPARLTPDWTFPNWALLPGRALRLAQNRHRFTCGGRCGLVALAVVVRLRALLRPSSPSRTLTSGLDSQSAELAGSRCTRRTPNDNPARLYSGFAGDHRQLCRFIWPGTDRLFGRSVVGLGPALRLRRRGLIVLASTTTHRVCATAAALAGAGARTDAGSITRSFLGLFRRAAIGVSRHRRAGAHWRRHALSIPVLIRLVRSALGMPI